MRKLTLSVTTGASSGAGDTTSGQDVLGKLYAILYKPGNIDTGATVTVTCEGPLAAKALLTKASAGTADTLYYPRDLVHKVEDGAALTGTAGSDRALPLLVGKIKFAVASGANSKTGSIVVFYED